VVFDSLRATGKPAVVHLVGQPAREPDGKIHFAGNLAEAAEFAVALAQGKTPDAASPADADSDAGVTDAELEKIAEQETANMSEQQIYLRGLFTGGTLTDESATLLSEALGGVFSFDAADPAFRLKDPHTSQGHTIVDLGEDVFTVGRPHPMIDPSTRTERIDREADDTTVAVMLLDCVLGYGSHDDPAGAMVPSIKRAKQMAAERGGYLSVVASVTGTDDDPQGLAGQRQRLRDAGCVVMPTNYAATMLVKAIMANRGRL
jgi:FdrA protein